MRLGFAASKPIAGFVPPGFVPMIFLILFGIDVLAALAVIYFFVVGLADGSVSSFNITLWFAILASTAAILGGGWMLNAKGHRKLAYTVLSILAVPTALYAAFILLIVIAQPRWN